MQLISCGCSWANGAELSESEKPFGRILSELMDASYLHQAQDSASLPHMVLQLRSAVTKLDPAEPAIAVFLLTAPDRDLMWSKTRAIGTSRIDENPPPYDTYQPILLNGNDPLHRDWFVEYHSPNLAAYRANVSILALQAICRHHSIPDYYAWAFDRVAIWPEIDRSRFYAEGNQTMVDREFRAAKTNRLIKHPDQAQHQLMAQRFLAMIKNS